MNDFPHMYVTLGAAFFALFVVGILLWEMSNSKFRFRALCDNSGSMVVIGKAVTEKNGEIIDIEIIGCNEVYARHLDLSVKQVIGRRIIKDFFDGIETEWLGVVRDVISTHESRHLEFPYEPKATRYAGTVFCLSSFRKQCCFIMEETSADYQRICELVRIRKLMDMILEMSGIRVWQWNLKSDALEVIKADFKIVAEEDQRNVNKESALERVHPDDRIAVLALQRNFPVNNIPGVPVEFRLKNKLGEWCWYQAVAVKTEHDGEGAVESLVGVVFDIDSLKRSQIKIQEISKEFEINQRWLMYTLQQSRTGYCRWNVRDDRLYFSDNFWQSVCGLTAEEEKLYGIPDTLREFKSFCVADHPDEFEDFIESAYNGNPGEINFRCHISFLPERHLEVRTSVLERDDKGLTVVMSAFIIDITDIRRHEDALRAAMEAAAEANRIKGRFLAIMSHELRTPLNAIIGFSSILKEADISTQLQSHAESIKSSGEMLLDLINDLLDLAKIEAAKMGLQLEPVNLFDLIFEIKRMFEFKVRGKNLYFDLNCPQDLPLFNLDRKRTRQVLVNVLGNAVKFTQQGGITLDVTVERRINDGESSEGFDTYQLVISVRDTGQGISEENFSTIFNPFQQAANNHDNYVEGTGLGLAICKNLVELMGGRLTFESGVGQGSNFTVTLERVEGVAQKLDAPAFKKVLEPVLSSVQESSLWSSIPPEVMLRLSNCFRVRFVAMKDGMHVRTAHALVEDLTAWMKDNDADAIEEMVDGLRQAVEDVNVTEVKRIIRCLLEEEDENV